MIDVNSASRWDWVGLNRAASPPGRSLPTFCSSACFEQCSWEAFKASHQQALFRTMKPYVYVNPLVSSSDLGSPQNRTLLMGWGCNRRPCRVVIVCVFIGSRFAFASTLSHVLVRGPWEAYYISLCLGFFFFKMVCNCINKWKPLNTAFANYQAL